MGWRELEAKKIAKRKLKVKYVKYGLANFYGDYIEINEALRYNKPLRDYVVKHELGHSKKFDLGYEFKDGLRLLRKPQIIVMLVQFYIMHPRTWIDLLPVQVRKKQIIYDVNLIILYVIIAFLIGFGIQFL